MAWNDGISKELNNYLESVSKHAETAVEAIKEQIDIEAELVRTELEQNTPRGATLGLLSSLRKVQIVARRNWYGYAIEFVGIDSHGTPYQKIANILNYGTSTIQGTRFISRAIRKLKGMDERIVERFKKKTQ
jgi:Iap family predicted aminopeptidase